MSIDSIEHDSEIQALHIKIERIYSLFEVLYGSSPCKLIREMEELYTTPDQLRFLLRINPLAFLKPATPGRKTNPTTINIVQLFCREKVKLDYNKFVTAADLYRSFISWIENNQVGRKEDWSKKMLGGILSALGYQKIKRGKYLYTNMTLA